MNLIIKTRILTSFLITISIVLVSCESDEPTEPFTTRIQWTGSYQVIAGFQTPAAETLQSTIELVLTDESYFFNSGNSPDSFCSTRGDYNYSGNTISFSETNRTCESGAKESDSPGGTFDLSYAGDDLILEQFDSGTLKKLVLKEL